MSCVEITHEAVQGVSDALYELRALVRHDLIWAQGPGDEVGDRRLRQRDHLLSELIEYLEARHDLVDVQQVRRQLLEQAGRGGRSRE